MDTTRRDLLRGVAALSALPAASQTSPAKSSGPPPYRIIYNWDGAPHDYSGFPQSLEQFLEKTYAPMKDTQVDAHFWCIGEHEAKWRSDEMEMVGESENRVYNSARSMRHNEGIRAMLDRGEDPYAALVQRGRDLNISPWASVRMNDNHFNGLQVEDIATAATPGLTRLRKEHPDWCLGAGNAPKWFAASWNFAQPEVREHRLKHITEVARLADWDGIELDWQRHAFHLPLDDAYRLRYTLTDLQRAVRQMTNRIGRERGRPLYLAVRVATTLESCRRIGYDLPIWVKEGLCDAVIAGGGALTDPGVEVEKFRELLRGTGIRFYPGFDSGFWGEHRGLRPEAEWNVAWVRAMAQGYWGRGADGMYVFNWHANERARRPLLTTIGSPETLRGTDKVYANLHRHITPDDGPWAGADLHDRIHGETPVALHHTLTADGPRFHVSVHESLSDTQRVELHIELDHYTALDKVRVTFDGNELGRPAVRSAARELDDDPADFGESSWLVWPLAPQSAGSGTHEVQTVLIERNRHVKPPLLVKHVEIHVRH
jgi:hypothetical protein